MMLNNIEPENETVKNLKCPCCGEYYFREDLLDCFTNFLKEVDKDKIHYIEGYRCSYYNEQMNGDPDSPHLIGGAIDFHFNETQNVLDIYNIAKMHFPRIGLYINFNDKIFIHVDNDDERNNLYWLKEKDRYIYFKTYVDFENWINVKLKDRKI